MPHTAPQMTDDDYWQRTGRIQALAALQAAADQAGAPDGDGRVTAIMSVPVVEQLIADLTFMAEIEEVKCTPQ